MSAEFIIIKYLFCVGVICKQKTDSKRDTGYLSSKISRFAISGYFTDFPPGTFAVSLEENQNFMETCLLRASNFSIVSKSVQWVMLIDSFV